MNPTQKPRYTTTLFGDKAIQAVMEGFRMAAIAAANTIGPAGKNTLLEEAWGNEYTILNDGVRTVNAINPEDPYERAGVRILQEAAKAIRDKCGDGTSATSLLSLAITDEILKVVAAGNNPMLLRRELDTGLKKCITRITELSTPVTTVEQKTQIATISCQDPELGTLIAQTIHKIGDHGVVTVEESKGGETVVETQEGMQIDKGYAHWFMVTDPDRNLAILEDAAVVVTDLPLSDLTQSGQFLNQVVLPNAKRVLFISPSVDGDFEKAMLGARQSGQFLGLAVTAPGIGINQTNMLMDIAALTGATFISKDAGMQFDKMNVTVGPDGKEIVTNALDKTVLGHVDRVVATKLTTTIQGGGGSKEAIMGRIQVIQGQLTDETISDYDREQLKGRIAKLTNGVSVIKVGGQTEVEMKERKERVIDAVASCQSATKHGMVPGGEIIYLNILDQLDTSILGEKILHEALKKPFKQLVENGGYDGGQQLERREDISIRAENDKMGLDILDGTWKHMINAGIVDPTNVSVTALKTAVSIAEALSSLGSVTVLKNIEL